MAMAAAVASSSSATATTTMAAPAVPRDTLAEFTNLCRDLVFSGAIRVAFFAFMTSVDRGLAAAVQRANVGGDVMRIADTVTARYAPYMLSAIRMADRLPPPSDAMVQCVAEYGARLLLLVRQAPGGDGTAAAATKKVNVMHMGLPLLYAMYHGVSGMVEFGGADGTQVITCRVAAPHESMPTPTPGADTRYFTFVPAHPWLGRYLPDANIMPEVTGWYVHTGNLLKRKRNLDQCFLAVMRTAPDCASTYCVPPMALPTAPAQ